MANIKSSAAPSHGVALVVQRKDQWLIIQGRLDGKPFAPDLLFVISRAGLPVLQQEQPLP